MVLNQIECPPTKSKQNIGQLFNKWMPEMEKYAVDYVGLGDIAGTTSNKRAKKTAIGTNKFIYFKKFIWKRTSFIQKLYESKTSCRKWFTCRWKTFRY